MEEWRDITGYEGIYQISNYGRVKSLKRECKGNKGVVYIKKEKILTPTINDKGYYHTVLRKDCKSTTVYIHRLVCEAFIDNPNNYPIINHRDEDKTNNKVENLEWCDYKYNMNYGTAIQRMIANTDYKARTANTDYKAIAEKISKKIICIETGVIYSSAIEIRRQLGFDQGYISNVCNGKLKQAYGFHWSFLDQ